MNSIIINCIMFQAELKKLEKTAKFSQMFSKFKLRQINRKRLNSKKILVIYSTMDKISKDTLHNPLL